MIDTNPKIRTNRFRLGRDSVSYRLKVAIYVVSCIVALEGGAVGKSNYYVINNAEKKIYGTDISADQDGNLSLKLSAGGRQRFKRGTYIRAYCPKPKQLRTAEALARKNDASQALTALDAVYESHRFLGWAGRIALLKSELLGRQKKFAKAKNVIKDAERFPMSEKSKMAMKVAEIDILIGLKELDSAEAALDKLDTLDPKVVAFKNNSMGKLRNEQGKKEQAVLNYLRTILLCPKSVKARKTAYTNVIALLKEMNDNRYKDFMKKMKEEYK